MTLELTNNVSKATYSFEVTDLGNGGIFYSFDIELQDGMADGDYEYRLYEDGKEKGVGIVRIGDYKADTTQYNNHTNYLIYNG